MTKPLRQIYLLLPLVFITWWTLTFGFNPPTLNTNTINLTGTKDTNIQGANIHAPNVDGTGSIQSQVRGGNSQNSPYISTSDISDGKVPKDYGDNTIEIDTKALQNDIDKGKVEGIEVIPPRQVQEELQSKIDKAQTRYDNNPTEDNINSLIRAETDLDNAVRDNECLIKPCVPKPYIRHID